MNGTTRETRYPVVDGKRLRLEQNQPGGSWQVYSRNWVYWLGTVRSDEDSWLAVDHDRRRCTTHPTRMDAVRRLAELLPDSAR